MRLPGWHYPAVFDLTAGEGPVRQLRRPLGGPEGTGQAFFKPTAVEKAKIEARKRGHSVTEQQLADGSVKLTIQVAGGAA